MALQGPRRLLAVLGLCLSAVLILHATIPVSDNFAAYSGGTDLNSPPWVKTQGTWAADGGNATHCFSVAAFCSAYWDTATDTFTANQHADVKLYSQLTGQPGPAVRMAGTGGTTRGMWFDIDPNPGHANNGLWVYTGGTNVGSLLVACSINAASGDTARISVTGSTYTLSVDVGSTGSFTTCGSVSDGTYASGQPGMIEYDTSGYLVSFAADNVSAGGTTVRRLMLLGVGGHL
jgi:hypothetical protein